MVVDHIIAGRLCWFKKISHLNKNSLYHHGDVSPTELYLWQSILNTTDEGSSQLSKRLT